MEKLRVVPCSEIAQAVRTRLASGAFDPDPSRLFVAGAHAVLIVSSYISIRETDSLFVWCVSSLIIGHSLACIAFVAHDLSHGSVTRSRNLRYAIEMVLWGWNFVPPTLWDRLHNCLHHSNANSINDPDRFYLKSEMQASGPSGLFRRVYVLAFCPHRFWRNVPAAPYLLHFLTYIARNVIAAFYPGASKPAIVPAKPRYASYEISTIFFELLFTIAIQIGIYLAVGCTFARYAFASPIAMAVTSTVVMCYVWTNHCVRPFRMHYHALLSSTSVRVPRLLDWLHGNFSYHSEHHLFPALPSRQYPKVSKVLEDDFPNLYQRVDLIDAWTVLLSGDATFDDRSGSDDRNTADLPVKQRVSQQNGGNCIEPL